MQAVCFLPMAFPKQQQIKSYRRCGFTVDNEILAVHPGRMNTVMGRTTAQIEAEEAAEGFCGLLEGSIPVDGEKAWFIDYKGNEMPL